MGGSPKVARRLLAQQARRRKVALLVLKGITSQAALAKAVGCTELTVSRDLKQIRQDWRRDMVEMFDHAKEEQLKRIDKVEAEAWAAWERSKRVVGLTKKRVGDSRMLDLARKCCEDRRKLLGLDEPDKLEVHGELVVASIALQKMIEENGEFIEYQRQRAFESPFIAGLLGDESEQREVEARQTFDAVGYSPGANGNGKTTITVPKVSRPRNRLD